MAVDLVELLQVAQVEDRRTDGDEAAVAVAHRRVHHPRDAAVEVADEGLALLQQLHRGEEVDTARESPAAVFLELLLRLALVDDVRLVPVLVVRRRRVVRGVGAVWQQLRRVEVVVGGGRGGGRGRRQVGDVEVAEPRRGEVVHLPLRRVALQQRDLLLQPALVVRRHDEVRHLVGVDERVRDLGDVEQRDEGEGHRAAAEVALRVLRAVLLVLLLRAAGLFVGGVGRGGGVAGGGAFVRQQRRQDAVASSQLHRDAARQRRSRRSRNGGAAAGGGAAQATVRLRRLWRRERGEELREAVVFGVGEQRGGRGGVDVEIEAMRRRGGGGGGVSCAAVAASRWSCSACRSRKWRCACARNAR